ncbi:acyltransferase family protein [Variovorax terrae]|uniref:Acyltransferase n=1 Tax=Variovorax terrae TaxID=2923278 RepID=A0A9X1VVD8_9BURK|nr:acyltransferase [Variovorax terrae]MCJ0762719.1 acyltransferase [Variovorax terrae]
MHALPGRLPLIDALKGLACVLIVWHHLAFYGPMSDIAYPLAPRLISWLYDYGRLAVHVFLVIGGFLAAASLAPAGVARFEQPGLQILRRYCRLVVPYLAALVLSVAAAALARHGLRDESVPSVPTVAQLLAHGLLLQDLLNQEALSAGVWYVAIDFQLFALTVLLFSGVRWAQRRWPGTTARLGVVLVLGLALLSLLYFNRHPGLDETGLYFFGSYGLGLLAFWAGRSPRPWLWLGGMAAMGALALAIDFRARIATALAVALMLAWAQRSEWMRRWPHPPLVRTLGQTSYSVFLVHFPVCLLVNLLVSRLWPTQPLANALGMLTAFVLSVLAGQLLHRGVEARPPSTRQVLQWMVGLMAIGLCVIGFEHLA